MFSFTADLSGAELGDAYVFHLTQIGEDKGDQGGYCGNKPMRLGKLVNGSLITQDESRKIAPMRTALVEGLAKSSSCATEIN